MDDKILFLYYQLAHREIYSKETSRIIENALISYLDNHIFTLMNGKEFKLFSESTGISYCNLVHYIFAPKEQHYSRRLSTRVSQIINNNLSQMNHQITQYYYKYVSKNQQKRIITWIHKQLRVGFSFGLFEMLMQCGGRISKAIKTQLKLFLQQRIDAAKETNGSHDIVIYQTIAILKNPVNSHQQ